MSVTDWFRGIVWGRGKEGTQDSPVYRYIVIGLYVTQRELKIPSQSQTVVNGQTYGLLRQALETVNGQPSDYSFGTGDDVIHSLGMDHLFGVVDEDRDDT